MACQFDDWEIGDRIITDYITCCSCWEKINGPIKGTYVGHFNYPSGIKAVVTLDTTVVCSNCGEKIDGASKDCDSDGLVETLFAKVYQEIETT